MMPPGEENYAEDASNFPRKKGNTLPIWGNVQSMNLNPLILTNIQASPYFKTHLVNLTTYHEVIDEIYYKVAHLEPWERGSRSTAGQTGMCGGVRGVGAGGIVSSAFCLLFKLLELRITRKQLNGLINHADSPYIRGLGFMYIRYTQPPADLWEWYEPYLDDDEEIDVKAGGGKTMTMGELVTAFMQKLEWFDTRFPRIPVNVAKPIMERLKARKQAAQPALKSQNYTREREVSRDRSTRERSRDRNVRDRSRDRGSRERSIKERSRERSTRRSRERERSKDRHSRERHRDRRDESRDRRRRRSRSRSRSRKHGKSRRDYSRSSSRDSRRSSKKKRRSTSKKRSKKSKRERSRSRSRSRY